MHISTHSLHRFTSRFGSKCIHDRTSIAVSELEIGCSGTHSLCIRTPFPYVCATWQPPPPGTPANPPHGPRMCARQHDERAHQKRPRAPDVVAALLLRQLRRLLLRAGAPELRRRWQLAAVAAFSPGEPRARVRRSQPHRRLQPTLRRSDFVNVHEAILRLSLRLRVAPRGPPTLHA